MPVAWMTEDGRAIVKDSTLKAIEQLRPGAKADYPVALVKYNPDAYYEGRVHVALAFLDRLLDPTDMGFATGNEIRGLARQIRKEIQI